MKRVFSEIKIGLLLATVLLALGVFSTPVMANEFEQPIKFSHKTHAGTNEIPCEFCHIYARRSISSGIPPVKTCQGCHQVVQGTEDWQKKEIAKVIKHWDDQTPIKWKKIHDVPDFVNFSHKRHIKIGFDCTQCHGDVTKIEEWTLDNMKQELSMGWCVKCHQTQHQTTNGKIAGPVRKTRGAPPISQASAKQPDGVISGSKDCYVCHK